MPAIPASLCYPICEWTRLRKSTRLLIVSLARPVLVRLVGESHQLLVTGHRLVLLRHRHVHPLPDHLQRPHRQLRTIRRQCPRLKRFHAFHVWRRHAVGSWSDVPQLGHRSRQFDLGWCLVRVHSVANLALQGERRRLRSSIKRQILNMFVRVVRPVAEEQVEVCDVVKKRQHTPYRLRQIIIRTMRP